MEYMGNKEFWDEKFDKRGDRSLHPEKSLVDNLGVLKPGSVLELACGDGRNTLFLASCGYDVTAIDFSEKALERLVRFLKQEKLSSTTMQIDLSKDHALDGIGTYDNVVINHYRLSEHQLAKLAKNLTENGILFVCGFGDKHQVDDRIRKNDLIQPSDFDQLKGTFDLVKQDTVEDERGYIVTYIFMKTGTRP